MKVGMFSAEGVKPQVRYLEGMEGIETARQMFERLDGDYVQIFSITDIFKSEEYVHGRDDHMRKLRHQHSSVGDKVRNLVVADDPSKPLSVQIDGETRVLSAAEFPIHGEITVRGGHVFLGSHKSSIMMAVLVSQEVADVVTALFDLAWKGAESYSKPVSK